MIGLYALEENMEVAAFACGLKAARLPYKYRNHNVFTPDQVEDFNVVVVSGLRAQGKDILEAYRKRRVPVIVIDYGYMRRVSGIASFETGHWQVGLNRLGWVPGFKCDSDRFLSLGLPVERRAHRGKTVLVCGQHAGDPSHGLDAEGIAKWAALKIRAAKAVYRGPVFWRPHPDSPAIDAQGADGVSRGPLDWGDVHAVVTINSNTGHEALLAGVPVFCREDSPYGELGNHDLGALNKPKVPELEARFDYFCRLAYGQWTLEEIRSGAATEFIFNAIRRQ